MLVAIISDTHMPRGRRELPDACVARLKRADLIVHAGDLTARSVLDQLRDYSEVVAVHGNADEPALRSRLPARLELRLGEVRVGVIHDAGPRHGRLVRLRQAFPSADVVVFGHSHMPLQETADDGFQIFNPGSPTERRRAPSRTMGVANIKGRQVTLGLLEL